MAISKEAKAAFDRWDRDPSNPYHWHDGDPEGSEKCEDPDCGYQGAYDNADEVEAAYTAGFDEGRFSNAKR